MRSNSKTRWAIIERKKSSDADFLLQGCWDKRSLYRKTSDSNALLCSWFCFIFRALNQQAAQCRNMSVGKLCKWLSWHLLRENQGAWVAQHFVKRSNMWLCCCTRKDSNKSRWLVLRQSARLWEAELAKDRASLTTPLLLAAESMAHSLSHLCKSLTCPGLSGASHLFSEIYMYCICMYWYSDIMYRHIATSSRFRSISMWLVSRSTPFGPWRQSPSHCLHELQKQDMSTLTSSSSSRKSSHSCPCIPNQSILWQIWHACHIGH